MSQIGLQDSDNAAQRWVDVSGGPECLVVNTGRMVERWTGGHFKAAVHRVLATRHSTAESSDDGREVMSKNNTYLCQNSQLVFYTPFIGQIETTHDLSLYHSSLNHSYILSYCYMYV